MIHQNNSGPVSLSTAPLPRARNRPEAGCGHALFDHYKGLVASLRQPLGEGNSKPKTVGVTCCGRGDGASTVSANLAVAAHILGEKVVLLDAHLTRPSLDRTLSVPLSPGLGDYLDGIASVSECLHGSCVHHLTILPAGTSRGGASEIPDAANMASLLGTLRDEFGLIVVDLPPVDEIGDCQLFANQLDGVLLVVAAERVTAAEAQRAVEQLYRAGAHLLGAVLNGHRQYLPRWLSRRS
jgi:capsular exopolysaccharide synthesis family protein